MPGPRSRFVEIDGRLLYLQVKGEAGPVVVIEVGLGYKPGTQHQGWFAIRDVLAKKMRVVLYDRAGYGQSSSFPKAPTIPDYAVDLHDMLHLAHLPPPYILIGGSIGGLIVTMFGHLYPDEVLGIVMVDAAHPEQWERMAALLPPVLAEENEVVSNFYEEEIVAVMDPRLNDEGMNLPASIPILRDATLGDLPLSVLTAGKDEWEDGFPEAIAAVIEHNWLAMQKELAALSTRGIHQVIEDSGHSMHGDRPDAIIEAVNKLLHRSLY